MYKCDICDSKGESFYSYNSWLGYCDNPKCKEVADEKEYNFALENVLYDATVGNTPDYEEIEIVSQR